MKNEFECGAQVRPHEMDEMLEHIWTLREQGQSLKADLLNSFPEGEGEKWIPQLVEEKLIKLEGNQVFLSEEGEKEAEQIIRRHRLTERLFATVFETSEAVWERQACEMEHQTVLTEEATSAVCAFLGHPPTCPHSKPIPAGECCSDFKKDMKPFVIPLSEASLSERYRIVFITPKNHMRLDRLAVLGVMPGGDVRVHQKKPSYVVRVGETDIALDPEIVRDIYVKKIND